MTQEKMSESAKNQENMGSLKKKCAGMNCESPASPHSPECIAEHAAAVANGRFVKHGSQPPSAGAEVETVAICTVSVSGSRTTIDMDWPGGHESLMEGRHELVDRQHVTTRDQQIAKLEARVSELIKALDNIYECADKECSHDYLKMLADETLQLDALAKGDQHE